MVIIGSHAIKYWYPSFNRIPKDLDIVVEGGERIQLLGVYDRVEKLTNPILLKYHNGSNKYATPNELYTLKMSHLFWNINWEKHMFDLQFLKDKGAVLIKPLFDELYAYWNMVHGLNKRSDLKMKAEDFFDNALNCEWDHDWLHTLLRPTPTFSKVLKDGEEVEVDEERFDKLTTEEKDSLVREEVMIMAFERYPKTFYKNAYDRMLKKFIISHAPIWEAIYIIENYVRLIKIDFNFIKYLNEQINGSTDQVKRSTRLVRQQA